MKWIWKRRLGITVIIFTLLITTVALATAIEAKKMTRLQEEANKKKSIRVQQLIVIVGQPQDESEVLKILSDWLEVEK